jgi:hypothetical protein
MTHNKFYRTDGSENNPRPDSESSQEPPTSPGDATAPSTEGPETISLGGLRFVQISNEEGEEFFARLAASIETPLNRPEARRASETETGACEKSPLDQIGWPETNLVQKYYEAWERDGKEGVRRVFDEVQAANARELPESGSALSPSLGASAGGAKPEHSAIDSKPTPEQDLTGDQPQALTIALFDKETAASPSAASESAPPTPNLSVDNRTSETDQAATKPGLSSATNLSDPTSPPKLPVPRGLFRCPVCNQYRGTIEVDDRSVYSRCKGDVLSVQCICDGIPCPRCKVNRILRPISNTWSEQAGFGHVPYFAAFAGSCRECRAKQEAEEAERKRKAEARSTREDLQKEDSK